MSVIIGVNGQNQKYDAVYMGVAGVNEGWSLSANPTLNIFCQPNEPASKEGLWIKTPEKHSVNKVINKYTYIIGGTWRNPSGLPNYNTDVNYATNSIDAIIPYGHKLFYFYSRRLSSSDGYNTSFYFRVLNLDTNTWGASVCFFQAADRFATGRPMIVGLVNGLIYARCQSSKYDGGTFVINPTTETFTQESSNAACCLKNLGVYNGEIYYIDYIADSSYSETSWSISKYNPTTKTTTMVRSFSKASSIYDGYFNADGCMHSSKIYFSRATGGSFTPYYQDFYSFDVLTGNLTTLTSIPYAINSHGFLDVDGKIYVSGLASTGVYYWLVYDIATNTWASHPFPAHVTASYSTKLAYVPELHFIVAGSAVLQGGHAMSRFDLAVETLENGTLAVLRGNKYQIKLISTSKINFLETIFENVWFYTNGTFNEYATYIGNGIQWIKIKN